MASETFDHRLGRVERELDKLDDYSSVRDRGLRNVADIRELRGEMAGEVEALRGEMATLRQDVRDLTRAIVTAALSFALSAIAIVGTLVALFK